MQKLITKLAQEQVLTKAEFVTLLNSVDEEISAYLFAKSQKITQENFGNKIYIRGLIEFSNFCKNDCYYCGIRCSNNQAERYRLSKAEIYQAAEQGYQLGFRTFVLQSGEDSFFSVNDICEIVRHLKSNYQDCAVTLSLGEKSRDIYEQYFFAGADRYLLREETASFNHYGQLHPSVMSAQNRQACLHNLKAIGFQVGAGFLVGSPFQNMENIADDLLFLRELNPEMIGIGPFIPHAFTPFADKAAGRLDLTLFLLGLLRLMFPRALLPATTSLSTLSPLGRSKGILAGANVLMPNLTPVSVRKKYLLYDNKTCLAAESSEGLSLLQHELNQIGYTFVVDRGDFKKEE